MKKFLKWIGIGFVVLVIIGALAGGGDESPTETPKSDVAQETSSSENNEITSEEKTIEKTKEISEPEEKFTKFDSGNYKIGTDMPAGEYKLFSDSFMAYFAVNKDSSGSFESIVANDNFQNFTYITVKEGQYLELKGCYAVPVNEAPAYKPVDGKYIPGKYKVGFDIPAGEYKVISDGSIAYVEVTKNSSGTTDSIITNDNFENNKYITVSDGQYLKLQNAYIEK